VVHAVGQIEPGCPFENERPVPRALSGRHLPLGRVEGEGRGPEIAGDTGAFGFGQA
jgi:hypothetical protein